MQLSNLSSSRACMEALEQNITNRQTRPSPILLSTSSPPRHARVFSPAHASDAEPFHKSKPRNHQKPPGVNSGGKKPNPQTSPFSFLRISFLFFFNQKPPLSMLQLIPGQSMRYKARIMLCRSFKLKVANLTVASHGPLRLSTPSSRRTYPTATRGDYISFPFPQLLLHKGSASPSPAEKRSPPPLLSTQDSEL